MTDGDTTAGSDAIAPDPALDAEAAPMTDDELRALSQRAKATGDAKLRRLVTSYLTLRRVTADVITALEARGGGAAVAGSPLLVRARALANAPKR